MARDDAPAGAMVVTDFQERGKGRMGRRWMAPAGTSLLFSVLFRPSWPPENAPWLTMIAGLATVAAIERIAGMQARLKWPNDVVLPVGESWLKAGGMLLEGQFAGGRLGASILGIGLNVNITPEQLLDINAPATSLLKESGRPVQRAELLNEILLHLESGYEAAEMGRSPRAVWERKLVALGRRITVSQAGSNRPIAGVAEGVDEWGRLVVRDDNGRQHLFSAGDVTLRVDNSGD